MNTDEAIIKICKVISQLQSDFQKILDLPLLIECPDCKGSRKDDQLSDCQRCGGRGFISLGDR